MIVSCPSCQRNYVVADEQIAGKQFRARCKSCGVEFRLDGTPSREPPPPGDAPQEPAKFMSATEAYLALQTAPPPSGGSWSVCLSQTDTRRMTTDEVAAALAKGTISTNVFVWKNGMPKWLRLSDVPELMATAGKSSSRVPQAVVVAEPVLAKSDPAARASKPAAPNRFSSTIIGAQPPVPTPASGISARSGQTVPPPPMVPDLSETHSVAGSNEAAAGIPAAAGAGRRSTPAPPRRATLDIPVEVDLSPPDEAPVPPAASAIAAPAGQTAEVPIDSHTTATATQPAAATGSSPAGAGAVMLPPMAGKDGSSVAAGAPVAVSKWPVQKKYPNDSRSASKPPAAEAVPSTSASSMPPPDPSKRKRFAGAIVAMGAVGLVGILGGVAGAVYVMKSAMGNMPQASASVAVVALQPQAATPVAAMTGAALASPTPPATGDVIDADAVSSQNPSAVKAKSAYAGGHVAAAAVSRAGARVPEPKVTEPKVAVASKPAYAELPSLPPAVDPKAKPGSAAPASGGGAPFNRDAASAVLGLAASRAPSCKKPDGPTGSAKVYVTFDPSGAVVIANVVGAPIAGSGVAQCVANIFRRVKVPAFSGDRSSLSKDFTIPP